VTGEIRIQAPDARVAALLADRLLHLDAEVVVVEGEPVGVSLPASGVTVELNCILRATQRWLTQQRLPGTRMQIDGRSLYVAAS
jgi:hypothetical protein